jgi:phosphoserine phosphatase
MGRRVVIVSASPAEIVRPIAEYLGVDDVIATTVRCDAEGRYLPEIEVYAMGKGKADAMVEMAEQMEIDLDGSYAYSDSITDVPMLEVVGHPAAVNPEKELRKIAEEQEWRVLEFQRPVTMERAIPRPSPLAGVAFAASLGALGAAVFVMKRRAKVS